MELTDLVGEHLLDAVDFSNERIKTWGDEFETCSVIRFRLDGIVYTAMEDPVDGYRSHMKEITISEGNMANTFSPIKVLGRHRIDGTHGDKDDVLELIDVITGKTVLEVGTKNTDDYYPCFVANFNPAAMAVNGST